MTSRAEDLGKILHSETTDGEGALVRAWIKSCELDDGKHAAPGSDAYKGAILAAAVMRGGRKGLEWFREEFPNG